MASASTISPQSFNRYSYGLNNPYKYVDPTGMEPSGLDDETDAAFAQLGQLVDQADAERQTAEDAAQEEAKKKEKEQSQSSQQHASQQNSQQGQAPQQDDNITYQLLDRNQNQVPNADRREVSDNSMLGPQATPSGGYFLMNLQVTFDTGVNAENYKPLRAAIILESPDQTQVGRVKRAGEENASSSQTRNTGNTQYVYDSPGIGLNATPRARLEGHYYRVIFVAGEYNRTTGKTSSSLYFYELNIIFGAKGAIDTTRSTVSPISPATFIQLGGDHIPKQNKQPCPECLLKRK